MKYKISMVILFLLFVFICAAIPQSLKETIDFALGANPVIAAGKSQVEESRLDAKSTSRSTLPQIDFDASYRHVSEIAQLKFPPANPLGLTNVNLGVYDTYETGLTASYLLFSGFAQKNLVAIKDQTFKLNNQQLKKTEKSIALEVIVKYRQVQSYQLEVEALNTAKQRINLQIKRIKALVNQGMALSLDTLSLSLSRLNNDQKTIAAQANLETAKQELTSLVGQEIIPNKEIGVNEGDIISLFNSEMNNDLQMLNTRKSIMQTSQAVTKSGYYPKIGLFAGVKYAKPGVNFIENDWMTYGVWGVNLNWNLFKWGADYLKSQSQKAAIKAIEFQYQNLINQLKTKYDAAIREYKALQKQTKVAMTARNLAKRKMEIIQSRYNEGMSSVTEFNDANLELTDAEINMQRQSILLAIKRGEIDYLSGKPINEWSTEK
ncbi:MAG: TolC family protein [Calditrichaceae bacterium]|nr:TolC family protein [Calditrichaceae bacterium]